METIDYRTKDSDAQKQVWEMKDNLNEEIKDIPINKVMNYLNNKAKPAFDYINKSREK
jgi:hypothetical protein